MSDGRLDVLQQALVPWLRAWSPDAVSIGIALRIEDPPAMVNVAQQLLDCLVREILPLPQRYGSMPDGHPELAALPPLVDEPSRRVARDALLARSNPSLAFRSIAMAIGYVDRIAAARTLADAAEDWKSLFTPHGCLDMALHRTTRTGIDAKTIAAAFGATMTKLGQARS